MLKKGFIFSILLFLLISLNFILNGCATTGKQNSLEIQGLKNQIQVLEIQLQTKDREIDSLKDALNKRMEEKRTLTKERQLSKKKFVGEVKFRPSVKQIQIALENAGYNPGRKDGRMGRQTRYAIRSFQKANNLPVDGKVGRRTWNLLKEYLYKKIK